MLDILTSYPVRFTKAAGCSTDYSRLLGAAEKCCSAGRPSREEGSIGAGGCKKEQKTARCTRGVQNTGEELHIHTDNGREQSQRFSTSLPVLGGQKHMLGFGNKDKKLGIRGYNSVFCWERARLH